MIRQVTTRLAPSAGDKPDDGDPPTIVRVSRTNSRGWSMEPLIFEIRPRTVVVIDNRRAVAELQRTQLRIWIRADTPDPLEDAGTVWTRTLDDIRVSIGRAVYALPSGSERVLAGCL